MTSSMNPTRETLEDLHSKVAAVCCDPQLKVTLDELRPMSWHKFLATASEYAAHMSLEKAKEFWTKEKMEAGETTNISSKEVETLEKFRNVVHAMIEGKKPSETNLIQENPQSNETIQPEKEKAPTMATSVSSQLVKIEGTEEDDSGDSFVDDGLQ